MAKAFFRKIDEERVGKTFYPVTGSDEFVFDLPAGSVNASVAVILFADPPNRSDANEFDVTVLADASNLTGTVSITRHAFLGADGIEVATFNAADYKAQDIIIDTVTRRLKCVFDTVAGAAYACVVIRGDF